MQPSAIFLLPLPNQSRHHRPSNTLPQLLLRHRDGQISLIVGDAALQAAMKADALLVTGDIDGQGVWKRILAAVEDLLLEDCSLTGQIRF
ncbi:MAG: hypothetical protein HN578_06575 [Rhodospirillales bacterium]|nr:hypothetical protein [Rhodospirillales bacterium]MBT8002564.1 hypothetical protein [Rhodospirillales bacterium]